MMKCTNCVWAGEDVKLLKGRFCPVCGDNVKRIGEDKPKLDLNNDGKVDKADVKIAASLMGKQKKRR